MSQVVKNRQIIKTASVEFEPYDSGRRNFQVYGLAVLAFNSYRKQGQVLDDQNVVLQSHEAKNILSHSLFAFVCRHLP